MAAAPPPPPPQAAAQAAPESDTEWRNRLHAAMVEAGLNFSADALAQAHVAMVNGELQITAPKSFHLDLGRGEILRALTQIGLPGQRFKPIFGDVKAAAPITKPAPKEDEVTERALAHPEVQKFRELFGGEVRTVRNLKEPETK
jgi:DNA polymerase III subunit gamma/tau